MKKGLLLINLGTPKSTQLADVKRYLREFLTDKRVIDIPSAIRYILVHGIIVPFRSRNTAHAYQSVWTEKGSPLLVYSQEMAAAVQEFLGDEYLVVLGMRYGSPSIAKALHALNDCEEITVLPLYPQYSSAATGSSIEEVMRLLSQREIFPSVKILRDFYKNPSYIESQANLIQQHLTPDSHLLFSYHGLPVRQIIKGGCASECLGSCPAISLANQGCYRAQCFATSHLIAERLHLDKEHYTTAFQSRLGKTPWIKPYTDEILTTLLEQGVKNLAVACPSFTVDCLETLEEIGMRLKEQWQELGGKDFTAIPCLNTDKNWIEAVANIVNE